VRHCLSRIIQASIWTTSCKHHWKHFVRGGLIRTTTFKQQEDNAVDRSTVRALPESCETHELIKMCFQMIKFKNCIERNCGIKLRGALAPEGLGCTTTSSVLLFSPVIVKFVRFVLTLFIFKAPNYVLAQTLTERVGTKLPHPLVIDTHFQFSIKTLLSNQTPTHTPPGGARPTPSAQCGPICTRTPSHPRRPLPLALITPSA